MEAASSLVSGLIELHPLVLGVVATALAAVGLSGFVAIGSIILPSSILSRDEIGPSASILVGSGVTAFFYALLTRTVLVDVAIAVIALGTSIAIVYRHEYIAACARSIAAAYQTTLGGSMFLRVVASATALILWIYSIAPPRDGDVMRYHLAHIRQIIRDGKWETIPDYHYAFPFGWTLNYLPFERIHVPEAAALLNAGLLIVVVAGLLHAATSRNALPAARLGMIAVFAHPFIMRTFGSAMADAYAILVVSSIAVLVLRLEDLEGRDMALLGFVSWIGMQSRYQQIAWGAAATLLLIFFVVRRAAWKSLGRFAIGAGGALILSAPFYIANARGLGNPFWPLLVREMNGTSAYTNQVAVAYTNAMTGIHEPGYMMHQLWQLVSTPSFFPIALISLAMILLCLRLSDRGFRRVAILGSMFFLLWLIAEPKLFPRHVLLFVPIVALLFVPVSEFVARWKTLERVELVLLRLVIAVFVFLSAGLVADYARYDVTGDKNTYHRFTWYYPTYDWVNRSTPSSSRFLVITYSGHSYYLDRAYRRADPWLSGVVDWKRVSTAAALAQEMKDGRYDYIIYDDRDWSGFAGGREMENAISGAVKSGVLTPVHAERERLYTSRAARDFDSTTVVVYQLGTAAP